MKIIAFLNNKGGVGKTASVTTLAHIIAAVHKKRVLVVDLDPQANTSSRFSETNVVQLIVDIMNGGSKKTQLSVEDLLLDSNMDPHQCIRHTDYEGLDLIPAFLTLSEAEEIVKSDVRTPQQFRLRNHMEKLDKEYDFCLIDCGPSISILNINGLAAADEVYIPSDISSDSCVGVALTINLIKTVKTYNSKLQLGGCFLTKYNPRKGVSKEVLNLLNGILPPNSLLPFQIGVTKFLEENTWEQQPLLCIDHKMQSGATKAYMDFADYIVKKADKKEAQ